MLSMGESRALASQVHVSHSLRSRSTDQGTDLVLPCARSEQHQKSDFKILVRGTDFLARGWTNFSKTGTKISACAHWEHIWWIYIYQLATLCAKFPNRHETTLAKDRACLCLCRWPAPAPTCSRLARPLIMTPTMYSHLDWQGLCWEIQRSKPLSYHATQHKCPLHKLSACVYGKWALRLKILIIYSQKFSENKISRFQKIEKLATSLTLDQRWVGDASCIHSIVPTSP